MKRIIACAELGVYNYFITDVIKIDYGTVSEKMIVRYIYMGQSPWKLNDTSLFRVIRN